MTAAITPAALWRMAPSAAETFDAARIRELPEPAQRYLRHAIAPGTPLASAVQLRMHGEIKLKKWLPFEAEQVISWPDGFIWSATVRQNLVTIRGFDRLVNGAGEMRWKLFGLIPVLSASGSDVTRSAAGRVVAETVWLPSACCRDDVVWVPADASTARCRYAVVGETVECDRAIDDAGRLRSVMLRRWADPDGTGYRYVAFGGSAEHERTFGGYTIATSLRIGYFFGSDRFASDGEFIRITVDDARFN